MNSTRNWIFRGLSLAGLGLWIYTWFQPWWVAFLETLQENGVVIYPYMMQISGNLRSYPQWIKGAEMPVWFWPLMWVYLAVCIGAVVMSLFSSAEDKVSIGKLKLSLPQLLVGFAGLAFIIYVVVFVFVISLRAPQFYGVALQGNVFVTMDEHTESYVRTALQPGYWMACGAAIFLFLSALFHKVIVGK